MRVRKRITGDRLNTPKQARRYRQSVIEWKLREPRSGHRIRGAAKSSRSAAKPVRTKRPVRRI